MLIPDDALNQLDSQYEREKFEGLTYEDFLHRIYGPWFPPMNRILAERRAAGPVDPNKVQDFREAIARLRKFSVRECIV